jgi:uncharacterized repeat protein (TIGR01451 family)
MRTPRLIALAALLATLVLAGRPAAAAEPSCSRWDLEVACQTNPPRVIVGDPFTATVTVRNVGDVALANVTVQLRGDLGARATADSGPQQAVIEKLEPGETKSLAATFACDAVGVTRIIGGARDALGWAAANCACTVDVIGLPALQSEMTDKDLSGGEKGIFRVGETFAYVLEISNDAGTTATDDLKVVFTLPKELEFVSGEGEGGVTVSGAAQAAETSGFTLSPNQTVKITVQVKATAFPPANLVQTRASIQTKGGIEVAEETESTTLKQ